MPLGDVSQTNRAPDWLAPSIAKMPQAQPHPPGYWMWWEGSVVGKVSEAEVSSATLYATQLSPATTKPAGQWSYWEPSKYSSETQSKVFSSAYTKPPPIPATYLLLQDHYLPGGYALAGTTITEGGPYIPLGWTPTLSVDPLNPSAIQAFWNAGPPQYDAEIYRDQYQPGIPLFRRPLVSWQFVSPGTFILTGKGATLGAKSSG